MTEKLKPCPFCGIGLRHAHYGLIHPEGDGECVLAGMTWDAEHYAAAWNTRVASHPVTSSPVDDQKTGNVSVKLRDAAEVWRDVLFTHSGNIGTSDAEIQPAAVIEADRQAVRTALVAEIVADLLKEGSFECAGYVQGKWGKP